MHLFIFIKDFVYYTVPRDIGKNHYTLARPKVCAPLTVTPGRGRPSPERCDEASAALYNVQGVFACCQGEGSAFRL